MVDKNEVLNVAETKPWLKSYSVGVPHTVDYPKCSMYEKLVQTSKEFAHDPAWDFMGTTCNYADFVIQVDKFASALHALGVRKGDVMTIAMPTAPNGVIPIYALNKIGAIASMIHPLSPAEQIKMYLNLSHSKWALTLDAFYPEFNKILHETGVQKLILASIPDYLKPIMGFLFKATKGKKISTKKKTLQDNRVVWFQDLMNQENPPIPIEKMGSDDTAIILYSGGTTGIPKGIELTNLNMISEGMMVGYWGGMSTGDKILAILPIFHGFGLGVCVNTAFMCGGQSILIPTFTPETVAGLVKKKKPQFLIGVPTLFDALANNPKFQKSDLSCIKATFSGADTLPRKVKEKFEEVVCNAGGNTKLLEGYGLTEAVTAIMATPMDQYREGSVGIPFPDMLAKVCKMDTIEEVPVGEEGEICVSGPAVMKGYLNNPKATAEVLKKHADGRIWLHTGDIGTMDADGFFYFKLRAKRMLKVSGINVYPAHVEEVLRKHPDVKDICIIGIPDQHQITRVKAIVILKDPAKATEEIKQSIMKLGLEKLLKYECPREIDFINELPKTLVGKIHWKKLEDEELAKLKAAKKYPFENQ